MYEERITVILNRMKQKRIELGYPQSYMANKLGVSQNIYSKIELNNVVLTAGRFVLICEILELNPGEVLNAK